MRKLFSSIDDIYIDGNISDLTEIVTSMDNAMQNITKYTQDIIQLLVRYSFSNRGQNYNKLVDSVSELRSVLLDTSSNLNYLQNQICAYQNKIYCYEGMQEYAQAPNMYIVPQNDIIEVVDQGTQFNMYEMKQLSSILHAYVDELTNQVNYICSSRDSIFNIWKDSQFLTFSEMIDEISNAISKAIYQFQEFLTYLERKVRELE